MERRHHHRMILHKYPYVANGEKLMVTRMVMMVGGGGAGATAKKLQNSIIPRKTFNRTSLLI